MGKYPEHFTVKEVMNHKYWIVCGSMRETKRRLICDNCIDINQSFTVVTPAQAVRCTNLGTEEQLEELR